MQPETTTRQRRRGQDSYHMRPTTLAMQVKESAVIEVAAVGLENGLTQLSFSRAPIEATNSTATMLNMNADAWAPSINFLSSCGEGWCPVSR